MTASDMRPIRLIRLAWTGNEKFGIHDGRRLLSERFEWREDAERSIAAMRKAARRAEGK